MFGVIAFMPQQTADEFPRAPQLSVSSDYLS